MLSCLMIELLLLICGFSCLLFKSKDLYVFVKQTSISSCKDVPLLQIFLFHIQESLSIEIFILHEIKLFLLLLSFRLLMQSFQSSFPLDSKCITPEQCLDLYGTFPFPSPLHTISFNLRNFLCIHYSAEVPSDQFLDLCDLVLLCAQPLDQSFVLDLLLDYVSSNNSYCISQPMHFFMVLIKKRIIERNTWL